ncbi:4-(cytidine 5'-diphospho)-2-C-methyl-D-erythritol kinase [Chitinophaga caseinilytica]|uniref:4-(cytidine 5'-diphospho)-2-C-methyl-D-erythritol kinase n=1 Tax=Chitinophaga caseinilytica TaxID=2267521 RepID=UPI003C2C0875
MIVFPNCKINLGLHILRKRDDGFHDLETVFYPLPVRDALEVITAPALAFSQSGIAIPGDAADNLCMRAYQLLKADFPELPAVHIHLHKVIPTGAGLGGGSADGAFTLTLLNTKYNLGLDEARLMGYAAQLGSDCPFFIRNQASLGQGRGEILSSFPVDLSRYSFLLVHPGIHVNTGWAFGQLRPGAPEVPLSAIDWKDVKSWKGRLTNDFEAPVFTKHSEIATIRDRMYDAGAVYASMSGSGSAVYGIFEAGKVPDLKWKEGYFVFRG